MRCTDCFYVLFLLLFISCSEDKVGFEHASLHKCEYMLIDSSVQLLDVRTYDEYKYGWIERAVFIDFYADDFSAQLNVLDKEKRTIVYCARGGRSSKACVIMKEQGFEEVYNMRGGIEGWNIHGKEVIVPADK